MCHGHLKHNRRKWLKVSSRFCSSVSRTTPQEQMVCPCSSASKREATQAHGGTHRHLPSKQSRRTQKFCFDSLWLPGLIFDPYDVPPPLHPPVRGHGLELGMLFTSNSRSSHTQRWVHSFVCCRPHNPIDVYSVVSFLAFSDACSLESVHCSLSNKHSIYYQ